MENGNVVETAVEPATLAFFADNELRKRALNWLHAIEDLNDPGSQRLRACLHGALLVLIKIPDADIYCQYSIKMLGPSLRRDLGGDPGSEDSSWMYTLGTVYQFAVEFQINFEYELPIPLQQFLDVVDDCSETIDDEVRRRIVRARQNFPALVLKNLLHSKEQLILVEHIPKVRDLYRTLDQWNEELAGKQEEVKALKDAIDGLKRDQEFVALNKGFAKLANDRRAELKWLRGGMAALGALLLIPSIVELRYLFLNDAKLKDDLPHMVTTFAISLTVTLILAYFFRIALRSVDACKAQLVQLDLRITLCQFIQSYADYSEELKKKNPDTLSKFETLIFSGLVVDNNKLPSTFDGIEHLGGLIKAVRGQDK